MTMTWAKEGVKLSVPKFARGGKKMPRVRGFIRKGGVRVKGFTKAAPKLSTAERARRAGVAKRVLLPAGIKAVGQRGFEETVKKLRGKRGIESPEKLAGWLKSKAFKRGQLSPAHKYRGRKGFRKFTKASARMTRADYRAYLRERRQRRAKRIGV